MIFTLPDVIRRSAKKYPEKTAFQFGKELISYRELLEKTNKIGNFLVARGIKKGDRVGVYLNRGMESVLAVYGIMKIGAIYVPLDIGAPTSRTIEIIEDSNISYLFANKVSKRQLGLIIEERPQLLTGIIGVSEKGSKISAYSWDEVYNYTAASPPITVLADDLAYIIYTSGTTGKPKGIMHSHYSGLSYARLAVDLYGFTDKDVFANHCALHYDMSTLGYFAAPLVGATTVLLSDAHVKLPASLLPLISSAGVTIWYSVPMALIQMIKSGMLDKIEVPSLRWVLYAGEPFAPFYIRELMRYWPGVPFSNVYGPAEVNQCTYYNITQPPIGELPVPIGQFWKDTEGLIIDEEDKFVARGEIGELVVHSSTMMRGYWNQPELSRNSWFLLELNSGVKRRYYRTGDLVRYNEEGELLFLGRKDRQIKSRGYRIELDEVEHALVELPSVFAGAVLSLNVKDEGSLIGGLVVVQSGEEVTEADIVNELKRVLPTHAVPHRIFFTDQLPRTPAGKIDRRTIQAEINEKYADEIN